MLQKRYKRQILWTAAKKCILSGSSDIDFRS